MVGCKLQLMTLLGFGIGYLKYSAIVHLLGSWMSALKGQSVASSFAVFEETIKGPCSLTTHGSKHTALGFACQQQKIQQLMME